MFSNHKKSIFFSLNNFTLIKLMLYYIIILEMLEQIFSAYAHQNSKATELFKSAELLESTPLERNLSNPCTYLSAIYDGPTVRYVGPTEYFREINDSNYQEKLNKYKDVIKLDPSVFITDSEYRTLLHPILHNPGSYNIPVPSLKYESMFQHTLNRASIYGFSGSMDFESVMSYAKDKRAGFILGLKTIFQDPLRIKIDANKLFELFDKYNPYTHEKEIYHLYIDHKTFKILNEPIDKQFLNYIDYLDWIIELSQVPLAQKGESVPNLLSPGTTINISKWLVTQKKIASNKLSFFNFKNQCQPQAMPNNNHINSYISNMK